MLKLLVPALIALLTTSALSAQIPIKVVVVSMFEIGDDTGDTPGEFQFWIERTGAKKVEAPLGWRDYYLTDDGILLMCTGGGITNAATSTSTLALDDRFDLTKAYWLVAGIAGVDPEDASLGSAIWAKWVIDGDLAKEIDSREIPEDWKYGMIALGAKKPNTLDGGWQVSTIKFELNEPLVDWAYGLTKDYPLPENEEINEFSVIYEGYPNAIKPPSVMIGETIASSTYWHGFAFNEWANDWVKLHSEDPEANFMTSAMEDTGTATALQRIAKTGKVDFNRLLVLRTASNFSTPPIGKSVEWSLNAEYPAKGLPALEAAYNVTKVVVDELLENWDIYKDTLPTP
jgi:purine nucleoside permease